MSEHDSSLLEDARQRLEESTARLDEIRSRIAAAAENPDAVDPEDLEHLRAMFDKENKRNQMWADTYQRTEVTIEARKSLQPQKADEPDAKPQRIEVSEPLTYRSAKEGGQFSYFKDQLAAAQGDAGAQSRLSRHMSEMRVELRSDPRAKASRVLHEQRDLTTTDGAGGYFVPPIWLQQQWIDLPRAGRVTADLVADMDLPPFGDPISLPKLTGGAAVAIQASENSGVQETDPTDNTVSANVRTLAGQVDLSRQLFDRSQPGFDEIIMRDLTRDYNTKLDIQVLSGSGSSGQLLGIRNVSGINAVQYTDASPTAGELYTKIADAVQRVASALYSDYPDTIVMHPRRWGFFLGALDTAGRPLVEAAAGPQNALASGGSANAEGFVGRMQGLDVYVDANLPTNYGAGTNEDVVLVFPRSQIILMEDGAPTTRVFEDVGSGTLTVRISLWNYAALFANRLPAAVSIIYGTGLITPTF